jgi:hypothetical protein
MEWLINDFKNLDYAKDLPYIFSIENIKFPNGYLTQSTQYDYITTSGEAGYLWLPTSFTVCDPNTISSVTTGPDWSIPYGGRWYNAPYGTPGRKWDPTSGAAFSNYKNTVATCFDKRGGTRVHRVYYADIGGDPVPSILFIDENNEIGYKNLSYSNGILSTPEGNSDSWDLIMETVDPELLNLFATTSEKGKEYLNSFCLNTQNTANPEFASNERCGRGNNTQQTTTPFMSVDMAGIPTNFCTKNISTICANNGTKSSPFNAPFTAGKNSILFNYDDTLYPDFKNKLKVGMEIILQTANGAVLEPGTRISKIEYSAGRFNDKKLGSLIFTKNVIKSTNLNEVSMAIGIDNNLDSDFCACYSKTSDISPQVQNLIDANIDLFPDGVCNPGEIKDTCIPRVCVEPRCMSGKAYKSAEELRYKCPKFCSGLVNATVGENGTINYLDSTVEVNCGEKSVYIPKSDDNISAKEVLSTPPSNKNVEKIGLISGIAVISVIIVILIILILKKKL